jgi:hypothetical protein
MEATIQLPEILAHQLESLAEQEGTSLEGLVRRLVREHIQAHPERAASSRKDLHFPLIPEAQTGPIGPVTGAQLDEIFAREDLPS